MGEIFFDNSKKVENGLQKKTMMRAGIKMEVDNIGNKRRNRFLLSFTICGRKLGPEL